MQNAAARSGKAGRKGPEQAGMVQVMQQAVAHNQIRWSGLTGAQKVLEGAAQQLQ